MEERVERHLLLDAPSGLAKLESLGEPADERVFTTISFDAPDHVLASAGLALNRRLENGKSTWELELPSNGGTRTLAVLGGPAEAPRRLRQILTGVLRERQLMEITTHRIRRTVRRVRARGHDVATVAMDHITVLDGQRVESELSRLDVSFIVDDGRDNRRLVKRLKKLGVAEPARRIGFSAAKNASPVEHARAMLAVQLKQILQHDPGTRLGADPEDLHQMRVATRRARAVLRAARPLFAAEWAGGLRTELKWLGAALGDVRDLDVLLAQVSQQAEELGHDGHDEAFAAYRIVRALEAEREEARGALLEALDSERYAQLLDELEQAVRSPVATKARIGLRDLAAAEFAGLRKTAGKLRRSSPDAEIHRARVKAKRARYAAELAEPVVGKPATRFIRSAKRFQDLIGEHQDSVVADQKIRDVAGSVRGSKVAFAAGRLVERERELRHEAREALPEAWAQLERAGRRAWS